jgi:hypothetical protein
MLIEPLAPALAGLRERVALLQPWLMPHDLLAIAGLDYAEDAYTELVAWALNPNTHPASAGRRQQAWLAHLKLPSEIALRSPTHPVTQLLTADGIPDLVLRYAEFVVVVEAKTVSDEHDTPSGAMQTLAYAAAVRTTLGLPASTPVYIVFLTPDRRQAANPDAVRTSYLDFVLAMAEALDPNELSQDLHAAFKMVLSHFALYAVPPGFDSRSFLCDTPDWLTPDAAASVILMNLLPIHQALALFCPQEPS